MAKQGGTVNRMQPAMVQADSERQRELAAGTASLAEIELPVVLPACFVEQRVSVLVAPGEPPFGCAR
jgi:hypothetical protein